MRAEKKVDGFMSSVKDLHMDKKEIKEQVRSVDLCTHTCLTLA